MMGLAGTGLLRVVVVTAVIMKVERQKSAMGFTQHMDDGVSVCMSECYCRAEDAQRIDRDEGSGPPASKSLFQASQHALSVTRQSHAFEAIIF